MKEKLLIGVAHKEERELDEVIRWIKEYHPSSVGLELPEDYWERASRGVMTLFFGEIAQYLKEDGIEIILLENPETWDRCHAIELAKAVREGKIGEEDLRVKYNDLKRMVNPYSPPEMLYSAILFIKRYEMAFDILEKRKSLEEVMELWEECNRERESHMLEKILKEQPDMVIIGGAHAERLKEHLPSYRHVSLYEEGCLGSDS